MNFDPTKFLRIWYNMHTSIGQRLGPLPYRAQSIHSRTAESPDPLFPHYNFLRLSPSVITGARQS